MRYALGIEYDGSGFFGWQRLTHGESVQAAVEAALSSVLNHPVEVTCAGRTDSGVHAACQVVHFDTESKRTPYGLVQGCNSLMPQGVSALWCQPVPEAFHARFSARARRYRYSILNRGTRPGMLRHYLTWERHPIDADRMHEAAQLLIGEHDFSAFRAVQCQASHARRDMQEIRLWREGERVIMEIQANAFLHHMVRNIVGSLLPIGRGERPVEWMAELLAGRDRTVAGPTAPSAGLVFLGPKYPREWDLPASVCLP